MTYEEFEWHILRMAYEEGVEKLRPPMLAYALGLPHDITNSYIEKAVHNGVLELDFTEDGVMEYFVPGIDRSRPLPTPVWREESEVEESEVHAEPQHEDGMDGSVSGALVPASAAHPKKPKSKKKSSKSQIPDTLRKHIEERYSADGRMVGVDDVVIDEDSHALVRYGEADDEFLPARVESNDEAFCDPSRTMFMRQIRVYGSQSQQVIRDQVARLFQSFGYRVVDSTPDRMRFERGSVMFILALVPLFVLVLPLFVYLFLYVMGRSTIQQEPLELDVQFRPGADPEPFWDVELTFVGQHGVVLGAADQKVLNREIDTLREELRWALTGS